MNQETLDRELALANKQLSRLEDKMNQGIIEPYDVDYMNALERKMMLEMHANEKKYDKFKAVFIVLVMFIITMDVLMVLGLLPCVTKNQ